MNKTKFDESLDTALTLKWGTLKGWNFENEGKEVLSLMEEYCNLGTSMSVLMQDDTERQKEIILELIQKVKGNIYLDWDGKYVTKEEATKYIKEYGAENV